MEPCTVAGLAGVIVGALVGQGIPTRESSRLLDALGGDKVSKLLRLLELLEEPTPDEESDDGA